MQLPRVLTQEVLFPLESIVRDLRNITKYYRAKQRVKVVLTKFKHFTKLQEEKKKRRTYGLGSQAKLFYGPNFRASSRSDASVSVPTSNAQTAPTNNLDELVDRLVPSLTDHMLPALAERVRALISSTSTQANASTDHLTTMTPPISTPATTNMVEVNATISDANHDFPISH